MEERSLEHPWIFTAVVVVVWILLWVSIEVILFNDDVTGAVITGAAAGLAFAVFYTEHHYSDVEPLEESTTTGDLDVLQVIDRYNLPENPDLVETAIQVSGDS